MSKPLHSVSLTAAHIAWVLRAAEASMYLTDAFIQELELDEEQAERFHFIARNFTTDPFTD